MRKQTGAKKVDILGHSEGTVMPDYYAKFLGGAKCIDKCVSLAPIWHGTNPAGLATLDQLAKAFGFGGTVDQLFGTAFVLNTLDPAHKHAVPCRLVLPFEGG